PDCVANVQLLIARRNQDTNPVTRSELVLRLGQAPVKEQVNYKPPGRNRSQNENQITDARDVNHFAPCSRTKRSPRNQAAIARDQSYAPPWPVGARSRSWNSVIFRRWTCSDSAFW